LFLLCLPVLRCACNITSTRAVRQAPAAMQLCAPAWIFFLAHMRVAVARVNAVAAAALRWHLYAGAVLSRVCWDIQLARQTVPRSRRLFRYACRISVPSDATAWTYILTTSVACPPVAYLRMADTRSPTAPPPNATDLLPDIFMLRSNATTLVTALPFLDILFSPNTLNGDGRSTPSLYTG